MEDEAVDFERSQRPISGRPFCKQSLWELITNAAYVEESSMTAASTMPSTRRSSNGPCSTKPRRSSSATARKSTEGRIKHETLLRDLLRCRACGSPMVHNFTVKKGRRFRYYVCSRLLREGWDKCSTKSLRWKRWTGSSSSRFGPSRATAPRG